MDRRNFLKNSSMLAGGLLLGNLGMTSCNRKPKPRKIPANEKVNLACIGIGNQGGYIIKALHATGLCNVVALCDTDMGADHTLEIMNKFPDVPRFQDFRDLFDKMDKQFDAVCMMVPATMLGPGHGDGKEYQQKRQDCLCIHTYSQCIH